MKFGEIRRDLRKGKDMTQTDLAKEIGVSLRTIISYENSNSYPKKREVYSKLATLFNVDINYLLTEDEEFITKAKTKYGNRGARQAEDLVAEIGGLFAGGELSEADKDAVMRSLQQAYWDAKEENKKYTPHVTIGRRNSDRPLPEEIISSMRSAELLTEPWTVREITLMRSELSPMGPRYTPLGLFKI